MRDHKILNTSDDLSCDPQVIELEWRFAQGDGGGGYHKNYDGTPHEADYFQKKRRDEDQIKKELQAAGIDTHHVDLNLIWLQRKYGHSR